MDSIINGLNERTNVKKRRWTPSLLLPVCMQFSALWRKTVINFKRVCTREVDRIDQGGDILHRRIWPRVELFWILTSMKNILIKKHTGDDKPISCENMWRVTESYRLEHRIGDNSWFYRKCFSPWWCIGDGKWRHGVGVIGNRRHHVGPYPFLVRVLRFRQRASESTIKNVIPNDDQLPQLRLTFFTF